ncbi:hypothetical protein BESB_072660 [Besnoitia besnoiti]|uniref:Uncharacterized protein n=1 Tax=Besnoitia besnoiti TaxID=94643 RepID=A0A2A9MA94_BESBE|nr:uncharacterized protein BESB_072660 [Besnoitia besnoiti]PFH34114.1 hypothetical protein BESB_072660 [Besnoitia besnoiti]
MSLCACPASGRPYPSTLLKQFADPRGRAISCFAIAEAHGLVAVSTETYDPQTQVLLDRAYGRVPRSNAPDNTPRGESSDALRSGTSDKRRGVCKGTDASQQQPEVRYRQGSGRCCASQSSYRDQGRAPDAQAECVGSASRLAASSVDGRGESGDPAAFRSGAGMSAWTEKSMEEIKDTQHRQRQCFDNPDVCGRCVIFLDSRSLLPLREVVVGDLPDRCHSNLICCCCCGRCTDGLCRMCRSARRHQFGGMMTERRAGSPQVCAGRTPGTGEGRPSPSFHFSRQLEGSLDESEASPESRRSRRQPRSRAASLACNGVPSSCASSPLRQKDRGERFSAPSGRGNADADHGSAAAFQERRPQFFRCESLAFACQDRLLCVVSPFAGVKIIQLAALPFFRASDSSLLSSGGCADSRSALCLASSSPLRRPPRVSAGAAPPGAPWATVPTAIAFDIEGRYPRLLTHLEFVASFAESSAARLEDFRVLDAGRLDRQEQQEALLSRMWLADAWTGPSCGSADAWDDAAASSSGKALPGVPPKPKWPSRATSPRFAGPCTFLDCLVHFQGHPPVRMVLDVTHGNRVLRCMSLLSSELLSLCCAPWRPQPPADAPPNAAPPSMPAAVPAARPEKTMRAACPRSRSSSLSSFSGPPSSPALSGSASRPSSSLASRSRASSPSPAFSPYTGARLLRDAPSAPQSPAAGSAAETGHDPSLAPQLDAGPTCPEDAGASRAADRAGALRGHGTLASPPAPPARPAPGAASAGAGAPLNERDFAEGTWKVKDGVGFPFAVFKKKEDFRLRLTAGIHVTHPTPVSPRRAPEAKGAGRTLLSSLVPATSGGRSPEEAVEKNRGRARGTDYSVTNVVVPDKSFSHLEADFATSAFRQLLLSQQPAGNAKRKDTRGENLVQLLPLPARPDGLPTLADLTPGLRPSPGSAAEAQMEQKSSYARRDGRGAESSAAGRRPPSSREDSEEDDDEDDEADEFENEEDGAGDVHPEEEWLVALALPHALVAVIDLHHRVVARHKFGLSKSTPFDRLAVQREGRFLLAWKERQCSVLELVDEPDSSASSRAAASLASAPFYAPSGSMWRKFWRQRPPEPALSSAESPLESLDPAGADLCAAKPEPPAAREEAREPSAAGMSPLQPAPPVCSAAALAAPQPPLRLRLHLELPVGARFGHSGSKVERFVAFAFSEDPYLSWLVVVSRRGVNEHLLYLIDLRAEEQRGGALGREIFFDTAMLPVPTQIGWMPLTSSDLLVLPSHRRFLALLTDASAPHQEEAFVAPYVHFTRLTSNREHLSRALDFDRDSTGGSCSGEDSSDPENASDSSNADASEEANAFLREFSPFSLPSGRHARGVERGLNEEGRPRHRDIFAFSPFGRRDAASRQREDGAGREARPPNGVGGGEENRTDCAERRKASMRHYRRMRAEQRQRLEAAGLDPSLHSNLEEKIFYQPLEALRKLQKAPPSCWATPEDIEKWRGEESGKAASRNRDGLCADAESGGASLSLSFSSFCATAGGLTRPLSNRQKILAHLYASYSRGLGPPQASSPTSPPISASAPLPSSSVFSAFSAFSSSPQAALTPQSPAAVAAGRAAAATVAYRQAMLLFNNDHCQAVYWLAGDFGPSAADTTTPAEAVGEAVAAAHARLRVLPSAAADPQVSRWQPSAALSRRGAAVEALNGEVSAAASGSASSFEGILPFRAPTRSLLSVGDAIGAWHMTDLSLCCAVAATTDMQSGRAWGAQRPGGSGARRGAIGRPEPPAPGYEQSPEGPQPSSSLGLGREAPRGGRTGILAPTRGLNAERIISDAADQETANAQPHTPLVGRRRNGCFPETQTARGMEAETFAVRYPRLAGRLAHALQRLDSAHGDSQRGQGGVGKTAAGSRQGDAVARGSAEIACELRQRPGEHTPSEASAYVYVAPPENAANWAAIRGGEKPLVGSQAPRGGGPCNGRTALGESHTGAGELQPGLGGRSRSYADNEASAGVVDDQQELIHMLRLIHDTVSSESVAPPLRLRRRELPSHLTPADLGIASSAAGRRESRTKHGRPVADDEANTPQTVPEEALTHEDIARELLRGKEPALVRGKKYPNIWRLPLFLPADERSEKQYSDREGYDAPTVVGSCASFLIKKMLKKASLFLASRRQSSGVRN